MADRLAHGPTLSVRLPLRLARELQRIAEAEANSWSSVARRLIAEGLQREARADRRDIDEATR